MKSLDNGILAPLVMLRPHTNSDPARVTTAKRQQHMTTNAFEYIADCISPYAELRNATYDSGSQKIPDKVRSEWS